MDDLLREFCPFSFYQKRMTLVVTIASAFTAPQTGVLVFIGAPPAWQCHDIGSNGTATADGYSKCERLQEGTCHATYDNQLGSASAQFGLICGEASDSSYVQSLYFVGMLLGSWLSGWSSDKHGRRRAILLGAFISFVASLWSALSSSFWMFAISRLVSGIGGMCTGMAANVLVSESVAPSYRAFTTTVSNISFGLGLASLAPLAHHFSESWRMLMGVLTCATLVNIVILGMWIPESPFWLLTNNKHDRLEVMLTSWTASSGKSLPDRRVQNLSVAKEKLIVPDSESPHAPNNNAVRLISLLSPGLRQHAVTMLWTWFTLCAMYYGLTLNVEGVGSNKYISFAAMTLVEIPSLILVIVILQYIGRRTCIFWFLVMTTLSCGISAFIAKKSSELGGSSHSVDHHASSTIANWQLAASICGKFSSSAVFSVLYTYQPELLPTSVRTSGLGVCVVVSRFGAILCPFILKWGHTHPMAPYFLFTVFGAIACVGTFHLPETKDSDLPETLQDLHHLVARGRSSSSRKDAWHTAASRYTCWKTEQ